MRWMRVISLWVALTASGVTAQERAAVIKYANDHAWSLSPTADLTTPGAKTVTLSACPPG